MRKRGRAEDEREGKREWREGRGPDEAGPFRRGRMPHPPGGNGDKSGFHGVENFRNLGSMPWKNGTIWLPWRGKTANSGSMAWKPPSGGGRLPGASPRTPGAGRKRRLFLRGGKGTEEGMKLCECSFFSGRQTRLTAEVLNDCKG